MTEKMFLFGDSIAHGMGSHGRSYGALVSESLDMELYDFSDLALQVPESLSRAVDCSDEPSVAIIAHGITEAIPRPKPELLRLMPPRWRRTGWMDPRPYYSRSSLKRPMQKVESSLRWHMRNLLMRVGGAQSLMSLSAYDTALTGLVEELRGRGARVVILGPPDINESYFPGAAAAEHLFEKVGEHLSVENVSLAGTLDPSTDYLADGFHPNEQGHKKIADKLLQQLQQGGTA